MCNIASALILFGATLKGAILPPHSLMEALAIVDKFPSPLFVNRINAGASTDSRGLLYLKPRGADLSDLKDCMTAFKNAPPDILSALAKYTIALGRADSKEKVRLQRDLVRRGIPRKDLKEVYWDLAFDYSEKLCVIAGFLQPGHSVSHSPWKLEGDVQVFHPEIVPPPFQMSIMPETGGYELLDYVASKKVK